jgi:hypothetical protein
VYAPLLYGGIVSAWSAAVGVLIVTLCSFTAASPTVFPNDFAGLVESIWASGHTLFRGTLWAGEDPSRTSPGRRRHSPAAGEMYV